MDEDKVSRNNADGNSNSAESEAYGSKEVLFDAESKIKAVLQKGN